MQAAAVTHILSSLRLVQPSEHNTQDTHTRFLTALEDDSSPPKLLGVLSEGYARNQAKLDEAAEEAKAKGEVLPLRPTVPMALRAAVMPLRCVCLAIGAREPTK